MKKTTMKKGTKSWPLLRMDIKKNEVIEKIIQKQEKKIKFQQITTLSNTTTNPTFIRRISLTYYPNLTNKLIKIFKKHKIQIINNRNKYKI
jgi:hypothetical protein